MYVDVSAYLCLLQDGPPCNRCNCLYLSVDVPTSTPPSRRPTYMYLPVDIPAYLYLPKDGPPCSRCIHLCLPVDVLTVTPCRCTYLFCPVVMSCYPILSCLACPARLSRNASKNPRNLACYFSLYNGKIT